MTESHGFTHGGVGPDGIAADASVSGSPLTDIQKAYLAILEEAEIKSQVATYRSGLIRALIILEDIDPDAPGGADPIEPGVKYGPEGSAL